MSGNITFDFDPNQDGGTVVSNGDIDGTGNKLDFVRYTVSGVELDIIGSQDGTALGVGYGNEGQNVVFDQPDDQYAGKGNTETAITISLGGGQAFNLSSLTIGNDGDYSSASYLFTGSNGATFQTSPIGNSDTEANLNFGDRFDGATSVTVTRADGSTLGDILVSNVVINDVQTESSPLVVTAALASDTGSSASDGITSIDTLAGSAEAGGTITISNGTTVLGTTTAGADGSWSFTPAGLADGTYTLTASETDTAGNTGSVQTSFTLDTTAPVVAAALAADTGSSASDGITSDDALTGTAEAGGTITVSNGATVLGTTTAEADGSWSFAPAGLADGAYTLTASETDTAGNTGSIQTGFTLDTTAPVVTAALASDTGSSASDGITSDDALTGTAEAGGTVTVSNGTTVLGTTTAGADGSWSFAPAGLADGTYTLTASETDTAGNTGSVQTSFTLDTTAPVVTAALAADTGSSASDGITSDDALTGTAEAGGTVTVSNGTTVLGTTTAGADGSWSFTPAGLADGTYTLTASETDVAGNTGSVQTSFTLDTTGPVVTAALANDTGSSASDGITSIDTLAGSAEAGGTITISNGTTVLGTTTAGADGSWSFAPAGLADGTYTLTASETDAAGNTGSIQTSFTLDTTGPVVTAALANDTGSSASDGITSIDTLAGSAEAGGTITVSNGATVLGTTTAGADGSWSFAPAGLADGTYTLTASETDAAGNTGSIQTSFTLDTTGPVVTAALANDTGSSASDGITSIDTLAGSAEAGGTITISNGTTVLGTTTADTNGNWYFAPTNLVDASYALTASETDAAGNTGSATVSFILDTTAPLVSVALVSPNDGDASGGSTGDDALTGIADAGSTVTISNGTDVLGTVTADAQGDWSFIPADLADGNYTLSASETDIAGNTGSVSVSFTLVAVVDSITAEPSAPGPLGTGRTVTFTLATSQDVDVTGTPALTLSNGASAGFDPTASTAKPPRVRLHGSCWARYC